MKKLNITKEMFEKSRYLKNKYGKLEYVSESGRLFKTNKGKILKFKESKVDLKEDKPNTPEFKSWAAVEREIRAAIRYAENKGQEAITVFDIGTWDQRNNKTLQEIIAKFKAKGYSCSPYQEEGSGYGNVDNGLGLSIVWGRFLESAKKFGRKFVKESGEELYAEINLWPDDLQMWDELLNEEIDYDEYDFDEESTVFKKTAQFEDGCFADLKVNTNDREDGTLWAEVVLFDPEGHQLAYSEPNYSGISGEWELEADGKTYIVSVGSR